MTDAPDRDLAFIGRSTPAWAIVALLMAFSFTNYVNRLALPVAGDAIRGAYELSETQLGALSTAMLLGYTIFMIPAGWFSDRYGGRAALAAMGLGTAIFTAATGALGWTNIASQSISMFGMLWMVRAAMGVVTSPLYPAAGRVVAGCVPFGGRARANAWVTGAGMVGIAASYPLFGALMNEVGWPMAFVICGASTAALAIAWTFFAGENIPPAQSHAPDAAMKTSWTPLLRNRSLWIFTLSYATVGYVEYVVFYWSKHYFKNVLDFGETAGSLAAAIPPLCMGVCMPLGGWLSDWLFPRVGYRRCRAWVAMGGMVGCAAMLFLATLTASSSMIVACFALALGLMGLTEAPAWATAIDLGGKRAATSAAIGNTGGNAGGAISPTVTPWVSAMLATNYGLTHQESWAWGIRLAAVICLAGAVLWLWIDAAERHED